MKRAVLLILLNCLLLAGCQKPAAIFAPSTADVAADGSAPSFTITVNRDWKIVSSESWCRVSPASGYASDEPVTITLQCDANTKYDARTAVLTVTADEISHKITVSQAQKDVIISDKDMIMTDYKAQDLSIPGETNVDFTVTVRSGQQWIRTVKVTKGLSKAEVQLHLEENRSGAVREGLVELAKGNASAYIRVIQAPYHEVLEQDVPGAYQLKGKDFIYRKDVCQISRAIKGQDRIFSILDMERLEVLTVSGVPAETPVAAAFPLTIRIVGEEGDLLRTDIQSTVIGESDSLVWFLLDGNSGLIIRK